MFKCKTCAALNLLTSSGSGGVLHLDHLIKTEKSGPKPVREILVQKHPICQPATPKSILPGFPLEFHPVVRDYIDDHLICSITLKITGAAGPSGLDAHAWQSLCFVFRDTSSLCQALAEVEKHLCTFFVDTRGIASLLTSRISALDK